MAFSLTHLWRLWATFAAMAVVANNTAGNHYNCVMYLTSQHDIIPPRDVATSITHILLAFLPSSIFHFPDGTEMTVADYQLFTPIDRIISSFEPTTKVMVAIGGWGDSRGFEDAARDAESRRNWAANVKRMVETLEIDGVDIDWEYPGGNRDDYKIIPNSEREWETEAFVLLLQELRRALGPAKVLSVAVPGQEADFIAFDSSTMPRISREVDFINVMSYELMNRRNDAVIHHTGVAGSKAAVQRYMDRGAPPAKLNLGLPYYVKWYRTASGCDAAYPLGCPMPLMEDPETGADLGMTGGFSWHDETPPELAESFGRALAHGFTYEDGSYGYWDPEELLWWSFDTPESIRRKMVEVVGGLGLGGAFAWGLGEDAPDFKHLNATTEGLEALSRGGNEKDEL
ncbi:unnamed protein product [Clonostachys rosea]|uniref:chitinase n=1 Tax=Bionectria ochroleuca TaxID=29856 RepID=A0ABY6TQQ1_BIOOC|nr:unnamed protein product [Clonostachys rosea]